MKPGHYPDLPMSEYHGSEGISKSGLSLMLKSPLDYWSAYLDPNRKQRPTTPAMKLGSAIHCKVLEPHLFDSEYVLSPKFDRRSKAGKAEYEAWLSEYCNHILLDPEELATVEACAAAIAANPECQKYLTNGKAEQSYYWQDPSSFQLCKCRPDYVTDNHILVDLKTTRDASAEEFERTCANFHYEMSAAFSSWGYELTTGVRPVAYVFVVVETTPPYKTACYLLDEESENIGHRLCLKALEKLDECIEFDEWPGLPETTQIVGLPAYIKRKYEDL